MVMHSRWFRDLYRRRWKALTHISEGNQSPEKTLEKAIVDQNCGYVNQIPVASGLLSRCEERHVSIDLGRKIGKACSGSVGNGEGVPPLS